jgi:hypothetical protein
VSARAYTQRGKKSKPDPERMGRLAGKDADQAYGNEAGGAFGLGFRVCFNGDDLESVGISIRQGAFASLWGFLDRAA